jgi:hypothetical protein
MNVGDKFGTMTVTRIIYRQRRNGTQGAPLLAEVKCRCGAEKTVQVAALERGQRTCGSKGCRIRRPAQPKPPTPDAGIWYATRNL